MIQNNSKIVDCLEHINSDGLARNIHTYNFSTLYTKLDHVDIKIGILLRSLVVLLYILITCPLLTVFVS